jgi:hypothetical protein
MSLLKINKMFRSKGIFIWNTVALALVVLALLAMRVYL